VPPLHDGRRDDDGKTDQQEEQREREHPVGQVSTLTIRQLAANLFDIDRHRPYVEVA
jgi:hypothetical protein